jgi:hypothetical protein
VWNAIAKIANFQIDEGRRRGSGGRVEGEEDVGRGVGIGIGGGGVLGGILDGPFSGQERKAPIVKCIFAQAVAEGLENTF